jgi:tetratricopeptide (TPR) repeat protein/uncharacterized caspase-like protein
MVKKLHTLALLCALLALTATAQQQANPGGRTWAVVVGISKYQKLPGGQQLQFADRDAALFADAIQKRGVSAQNVKLLTGVEATSAAIKSAVGNWLARSVSESDTVLIFFSGHGLFEREFGESYLLGYDSDPKDPYGTALSVSELGQALARRIRSGRVLVIADAVRRDFFDPESDTNSSRAFEQAFDQLTATRPGLSAIIASGPGEFSREGQRWGGYGVFAKHLADVLFDGASRTGDLAATTDELYHLLKGRVAEDTSGKQNPWRSGSALAQTAVPRERAESVPATPSRNETTLTTPPNVITPPKTAEGSKTSDTRTRADQKNDVRGPVTPSKAAETRSVTQPSPTPGPVKTTKKTEPTPARAAPTVNPTKKEASTGDRRTPLTPTVSEKKPDAMSVSVGKPVEGARVGERTATTEEGAPNSGAPTSAAPKPPMTRPTPPPGTSTVTSTQPVASPPRELARADIPVREVPTPPNPTINPPRGVAVSSDRAETRSDTLSASVPAVRSEAAPSPLVLQLEAAIASRSLIEPRNGSAWDLYQRMLTEPGASADAARLRPMLAEALMVQGRAIVSGDVRGDNISDKVDEFKRAGQMLARARTLTPDNGEAIALEKLSAAGALISLQFYDEAERALAPLQSAKLAAVENALGLVHQGKLDSWRAERAFKRASELDPKWAAPHYNLALLYRSQQNQAALTEFEAAASSDQGNVNLFAALGDEYFVRQQWKQAVEAFRKAVSLNPSDDNLHTKLGHALYSQGSQDEANREYQKAQELRRKRQQ